MDKSGAVVYRTDMVEPKEQSWNLLWDERYKGKIHHFQVWNEPNLTGEWGGKQDDVDWGRKLRKYMEARQMGWTAWSWSNDPYIVDRYAVTAFGRVVQGEES